LKRSFTPLGFSNWLLSPTSHMKSWHNIFTIGSESAGLKWPLV